MTQPAPAQPAQPAHTHAAAPAFTIRGIISVCETLGFIIAAVLYGLNNGADSHNGVLTAVVAAVLHGVNHNAGGSPV